MGTLEVIFGTIVIVLAAVAVMGALVFVVVWEVCAIRRTLAARHPGSQPPTDADFWRQQRALTEPKRR
jgi:mannose/fructose/N-acetylgalactosamine-specific phosphotransferase system component IID